MLESRESRNILLGLVFFSGLGLVQVYSSTYIFAQEHYSSGLFFFKKQVLFTLIGFLCFFILSFIPWRYNRYLGMGLWFLAVAALVLTLIPSMGVTVNQAQRWLPLPFGFRFQPSELFKVTTPFMLAYLAVLWEQWPLNRVFFWMVPLFALGFPLFVLIQQPDFGTVVLICMVSFACLFVLGLKKRYIALIVSSLSIVLAFLIANWSYREERVRTFLNPWEDPLGKGFQVIQSLLSVHSGGFFGAGIGKGQSKLFFLPEAHTDFTLAVLAEELGFAGLFLVLLIYGFLVYNGFRLTLRIHDCYQKTVAFGLVFIFSLGVLIHSAVNLGLLPAKGLALPFLSYGGSALVCAYLLFGWLICLEKNNRLTW